MEEIITTTGEISTEDNPDVDYIATIQSIRESTVSKEQYEKLRLRNKQLLDALASGGSVEVESQKASVDIAELRKKLYKTEGGDISDLEYISNTLKLREAIMQSGGRDPFLPANSSAVTSEMIESAQRVAEGLQYCVDEAQGDNRLFLAQLSRITKDPPMRRK